VSPRPESGTTGASRTFGASRTSSAGRTSGAAGGVAAGDGSPSASRRSRTDAAGELLKLLPELAAALYAASPHRRAAAAGTALTATQMKAVIQLAGYGPQTMTEFAEGLEVSRAAASEMAQRLEEKGLALREGDDRDGRVIRVRLAGPSAASVEAVLAERREQVARALAAFPDLDPATLTGFVKRLIRSLDEEEGA
jgi:DNA-binding MarR family transcriptional regulator